MQRTRIEPPCPGCRREPPREEWSLESAETCWGGPSRTQEKDSQPRRRGGPLHRHEWQPSQAEERRILVKGDHRRPEGYHCYPQG